MLVGHRASMLWAGQPEGRPGLLAAAVQSAGNRPTDRPPGPACPLPRRTPVLRPQRMEFAAFNHRGTGLLGSLPHLRQLDVKMPQLG